jgi:hypothetical protein
MVQQSASLPSWSGQQFFIISMIFTQQFSSGFFSFVRSLHMVLLLFDGWYCFLFPMAEPAGTAAPSPHEQKTEHEHDKRQEPPVTCAYFIACHRCHLLLWFVTSIDEAKGKWIQGKGNFLKIGDEVGSVGVLE